MHTAELRRAIAEPAARAGRPFDRATVDLLLTEQKGMKGRHRCAVRPHPHLGGAG